jgi:hypothetical protein
MAHLDRSLPQRIELGAVLRIDWQTEVVETDGGQEVRNNRRASPARYYDVSMPPMLRADADYLDLLDLYADAGGMLHSFDLNVWHDETNSTIVAVRFDSPLQITSLAPHLDHIDTFTLKQVEAELAS